MNQYSAKPITVDPILKMYLRGREPIYDSENLVIGKKYIRVHEPIRTNEHPIVQEIVILSVDRVSQWVEVSNTTLRIKQKLSLADMGIIPYPNGSWNSTNFVLA